MNKGDEITNSQAHDDDLDSLATVLKRRGSVKRNDPQYITWTSELSNAAARVLGRYPEMARKVTIGASYLKVYFLLCFFPDGPNFNFNFNFKF